MGKIYTHIFFLLTQTFGQTQHKTSTNLFAKYNKTIYSATLGNNPSGIGLGVETFFNKTTKFKPTIEITGVLYLENDKVYRTDLNRKTIERSSRYGQHFYRHFNSAGIKLLFFICCRAMFYKRPDFFRNKTLSRFYFSKYPRWSGKPSYINIFNQG